MSAALPDTTDTRPPVADASVVSPLNTYTDPPAPDVARDDVTDTAPLDPSVDSPADRTSQPALPDTAFPDSTTT